VAAFGPAAVAVHDDRDVFGEPARIQMPVDFRFFSVQSRGNFVLQSESLDLKVTQGGRYWQFGTIGR